METTCLEHGLPLVGIGALKVCPLCVDDEFEPEEEVIESETRGGFGVWLGAEPARDVIRKRSKDGVFSLRLDGEAEAELRQVARRKGIGPSTLARLWLVEALAREREGRRSGDGRVQP